MSAVDTLTIVVYQHRELKLDELQIIETLKIFARYKGNNSFWILYRLLQVFIKLGLQLKKTTRNIFQ